MYLVRHGETEFNKLGQIQGWMDSPLTEYGLEVARYCGLGLKDIPFDVAYSSDLMRAVKTTEVILSQNEQKGIPHHPLDELKEISFGKFGGGLKDSYKKDVSKVLLGKESLDELNDKMHLKEVTVKELIDAGYSLDLSGESENYTDFENRIVQATKDIFKTAQTKGHHKILVVGHGIAIFAILNYLSDKHINYISDVKNASVTLLKYENEEVFVEDIASMDYVNTGEKASKL